MSTDVINLALNPREVTGKAVKHLRRDGQVPAVIHDHGKPSVIVQADYGQLYKVWQRAGKHHPVQLKAAGQNFTALIKAADFDPKKHRLTHVVFNAVNANETVEAEVPIEPQYAEGNDSSPAERGGLLVLSQLEAVIVKATPSHLPDVLKYDAEKLVDVGDHLTVGDLEVPEGVEIVTELTHPVATVFEPSALAAANDAAGGEAELEETAEETEEGEAGTADSESGKSEVSAESGSETDTKPE